MPAEARRPPPVMCDISALGYLHHSRPRARRPAGAPTRAPTTPPLRARRPPQRARYLPFLSIVSLRIFCKHVLVYSANAMALIVLSLCVSFYE